MKFLKVIILFICCSIICNANAADFSQAGNFQTELDKIRVEHKIPGLVAAIVEGRQVSNIAASGVRKYGHSNPVQLKDAFQIGSITKSMTATLAYELNERNILPIKTRIIDIFPELGVLMRPEYRGVTIEMLLTHLAAFPYKPSLEGDDEFSLITSSLVGRRYEYVKAAIQDLPEGKVGEHYVYSGGTIIAAAMMERKTGLSWGTLISKYVFKPLQMYSAGCGATSQLNRITGVWEHQMVNGEIKPIVFPAGFSHEPHAPAGRNLHVSINDLVKYMIAHFPYSGTGSSVLLRQSILNMQTKSSFASTSPGWFIGNNGWSDWKTVYHYGDNGKSIAALVFSPKFESGYIIMANIAGDLAWEGLDELSAKIEAYLADKNANNLTAPRMEMAATSLSYGKTATSSNVYYDMADYQPSQVLDGNYETRWATDDNVKSAWLEVDLGEPQVISTIIIKEEFAPRVTSFRILARSDEGGAYKVINQGKKIGDERILYPRPLSARFVRLEVKTTGNVGPTISEFQIFKEKFSRFR